MRVDVVRASGDDHTDTISVRAAAGDWAAYRTLSLWLFHTPDGAVPGLPTHVPVIALTASA